MTRAQRNMNSLFKLTDDKGEPLTNLDEVKARSADHFTTLYRRRMDTTNHVPWFLWLVNQSMNVWLTRLPTKREIENVVCKLSIDKPPGPDDFTAKIFQTMRDLVKKDVRAGLIHLFLGRSMV